MMTVQTKSGRSILQGLEVDFETDTVDDICNAIFKAEPKYTLDRQRLTIDRPDGPVVLQRGEKLSKYNIKEGENIIFKDLGPQIGWTTVFLIEYLGPMLVHAIFYSNTQYLYRLPEGASEMPPHTVVQIITFAMFILHFMKREYETVFVHRFSNDTMPLTNLPKNCFHYWVLGGIMIAYPVYQPNFTGGYFGSPSSSIALLVLVVAWIAAEFSNLKTHIILRDLRPLGTRVRNIPVGFGFDLVSCPNYLFEIIGWICVSLITGSIFSWIFTIAGAVQMYLWAVKKHKRYRKDFGDKYPRNRKVLIPFVL